MIDTHAHLDALEDPSSAMSRARAAGVERVVAIGSGIASARETLEIAEREDGVFVALGIHPHQAADDETAAMLEDFGGTVVLHCFSSPPLLPVALERGYYVSFAGNVTYPKAADLREAAGRVPRERILAETDCPYLAPQPVRGKTNEPAFVIHTLAALAETRGEDADELSRRIDENAAKAFGLQ